MLPPDSTTLGSRVTGTVTVPPAAADRPVGAETNGELETGTRVIPTGTGGAVVPTRAASAVVTAPLPSRSATTPGATPRQNAKPLSAPPTTRRMRAASVLP